MVGNWGTVWRFWLYLATVWTPSFPSKDSTTCLSFKYVNNDLDWLHPSNPNLTLILWIINSSTTECTAVLGCSTLACDLFRTPSHLSTTYLFDTVIITIIWTAFQTILPPSHHYPNFQQDCLSFIYCICAQLTDLRDIIQLELSHNKILLLKKDKVTLSFQHFFDSFGHLNKCFSSFNVHMNYLGSF